MRIGMVEWPDGLIAYDSDWHSIAKRVNDTGIDMLITNELPFGEWIASQSVFDVDLAQNSIDHHVKGLAALGRLSVPTIITSRPVWAKNRLANEAVVLRSGVITAWRRKQYFPAELGWYETAWYEPGSDLFPISSVGGVDMGVLLCTELMFNERARRYGRAGARLIAVPRATPGSIGWRVAGQMAAIVSGSYIVSSNRSRGCSSSSFGGGAFAFAPDGSFLAATTPENWLAIIDFDPEKARDQQRLYPCYVADTAP